MCIVALGLSSAAAQDPFVRVEDGRFVLDGHYYYFTGVNYWYGMNLGSPGEGGDRAGLLVELDSLAARGLTNLRIMASGEGSNSEPWHVTPAVQPAPREYNEDLLQGLDFLLSEMGKRDMKAVLILNNFLSWSGGMAQYVSWTTGTLVPNPTDRRGADSHDALADYASGFYADFEAQRLYLDYVYELIHRENHLSGLLYRDDPVIMTWELANEPRGLAHSDEYVDWVDQAAGFIQLHDPNHLVALGGAGKLMPDDGTQFEWVSTSPYLDYITIHAWIEDWGWFDPTSAGVALPTAVGRAMGYLADHVSLARGINKPMVLEAFGSSRDGGEVEAFAPTTNRDRYYRMVLEAVYRLALEGNVAAGTNVWAFSGSGLPVISGEAGQIEQPHAPDSPYRYAIYNTDKTTLDVLEDYARLMRGLNVPLESSSESDVDMDGQ